MVFQAIGEEHVLLAQLQAIPDVDECGRGGNFLAHGLVFTEQQFCEIGGNPITIAKRIRFLSSSEEARELGDITNGEMAPYELSTDGAVEREGLESAAKWKGTELPGLLTLAAGAEQLGRARQSVVICGARDQILETLALVFDLVPQTLRLFLSFKTHGHKPEHGRVWAQGFRESPDLPGSYEVNTKEFTAEPFSAARSSYGRWAMEAILEQGVLHVATMGEQAWQLSSLVDDEEPSRIAWDSVDNEVADEVWNANSQIATGRLLQVYLRKLGATLAHRALPELLRSHQAVDRLRQIEQGGSDEAAAVALHNVYARPAEPPGREEQRELFRFTKRHESETLSIWLACWKSNWNELKERLSALSDRKLERMVRDLSRVGYVDLANLSAPGREAVIVSALIGKELGSDLHRFLEVLLEHPSDSSLLILGQLLKRLSTESLAQLHRLISGNRTRFSKSRRKAVASEFKRRQANGTGRWLSRLVSRRGWQ